MTVQEKNPPTSFRDRVQEFRRVRASEILPNARNFRTHPAQQREAFRALLEEVGFAGAELCYYSARNSGQLTLIDGAMRREELPDAELPCLITDLDDAEADKMLLCFDPLAALAEADTAKLDALLREVDTGPALQAMLAGLAEENGLYLTPEPTGDVPEAQVDRAEELQERWQVQTGQVWRAGEHFLICGDCREPATWTTLLKAAGVERVNGVFTSPPYAEQRKDQYSGVPTAEYGDWWEAVQVCVKAHLAADGSFFVNIKPHCESGERVLYVFDLVLAMRRKWGWRFVEEYIWKNSGVPKVPHGRFKNQFEPIYQFALSQPKFRPDNVMVSSDRAFRKAGRGRVSAAQGGQDSLKGVEVADGMAYPGNVVNVNVENHGGEHSNHAAAFPVALPDFFLRAYSDEGDLWADPFCGSGTVLCAAHANRRRGLGIEKLEKYCAVVLERLSELMSETPVLTS